MSSWKALFRYAAVLLAVALVTSCIKDEHEEADATTLVSVGQAAPDFTVEMLDGQRIRLSDLRGDVVLLSFWDPQCPTCEQLMEVSVERIVKRIAGNDIHYLPISRGYTRQYIEEYCASHGYDFPVGLDTQKAIYSLYASKYVPRTFLIDKRGIIRHLYVEYDLATLPTILSAAESLAEE